MRQIVFCILFCLPAFTLRAQAISILEARQLPTGSEVTVRGIVTNDAELGKIRFLQDGTAGIAAFPGSGSVGGFDTSVGVGDSIEVSGKLLEFNGLLEISPISAFQVISSGNTLPEPKKLQLSDFSDAYEGQLIQTACVSFEDAGAVFNAQGAYNFFDETDAVSEIFIRNTSPLLGTDVPPDPVAIVGILSQFNDYQVLPRYIDDLQASQCFYFIQHPELTDIQQNSVSLRWATNQSATALVRYGNTPALGATVQVGPSAVLQEYTLSGLQAGSIYWVQVLALHNSDTLFGQVFPLATRSTSSGEIRVYFSFPIDTATAGSWMPAGQSVAEVLAATIARIDSAQQTLDVAMYNNSRDDITQALKNAAARGVRVRYIAASDTENYALDPAPDFPVVYGNDQALMHNKFLIADADLPDKCWLMCGSMNWTTSNVFNAHNNTLFIQDQSLAKAYRLEFEEMWGGAGEQPVPGNARFGAAKTDNTPHRFVIGGIPVESYFSPSDKTSSQIYNAISTADESLAFALLTFTRNDLAENIVDRFQGGATARGMIENVDDIGSEVDFLQSNGIVVLPHPEFKQLHHKYGVIDALTPASDPLVVTGSHNWTNQAENANDENTLIIHDAAIARLYLAEFNQRWKEQTTATRSPELPVLRMYPNPVTDELFFEKTDVVPVSLEIWRADGTLYFQTTSTLSNLNVQHLPDGWYYLKAIFEYGIATVPFQKIHR